MPFWLRQLPTGLFFFLLYHVLRLIGCQCISFVNNLLNPDFSLTVGSLPMRFSSASSNGFSVALLGLYSETKAKVAKLVTPFSHNAFFTVSSKPTAASLDSKTA